MARCRARPRRRAERSGALAEPVFEAREKCAIDAERTASVLHGLYWLVANLAERSPLVLLVDDAHWLDPASARFLVYLSRRIDSLPVLLAVAARGGEGLILSGARGPVWKRRGAIGIGRPERACVYGDRSPRARTAGGRGAVPLVL